MGSAVAKNNKLSSNSRTMSSSTSSSADPGASAAQGQSLLYRRRAHHAGSWYQKDSSALDATLQNFLDKAADASDDDDSSSLSLSLLRAIICPHAGFSYSGPTAAYSYHALQQSLTNNKIKTILVLHPSHHVYINGCAVSGASVLETPLLDNDDNNNNGQGGDLIVNDALRREILALNDTSAINRNNDDCVFFTMTQSQDEEEHSGEMQYPFLAKVIQNVAARQKKKNKSTTTATAAGTANNGDDDGDDTAAVMTNDNDEEVITVLPIMCGSLSVQQEIGFGILLSEIIHRPEILTVVSTDFCHWGSRFSYRPTCTTTSSSNGGQDLLPIHQLIEQLDRRGMSLIEAQEPGAFAAYLKETKNTICGRHAVAVWLRALEAASSSSSSSSSATLDGKHDDDNDNKERGHTVRFIRYAQSSPVTAMNESSVSYAAAIATTTTNSNNNS